MSSLGDKLRQLCANSNDFYVPEYDKDSTSEDQDMSVIDLDDVETGSRKHDKNKKSIIDKIESDFDDYYKKNSKFNDNDDDFDDFLDNLSDDLDEDDIEFRNSIIDMGRKYARETAISEGTSEIQRMFSSNEKKLQTLLKEIREDKKRISTMMDKMSPRAASPKAVSELQETRNTLHNAELSAIKESNNMKKTEIELSLKAKSQKNDEQGSISSGNLIRDLFSVGRKDMISSMGGYENVSGSFDDSDDELESSVPIKDDEAHNENDEDEHMREKYLPQEESSNGFIKYKDSGAHYILEIDDEGNKQIYAEDRDGNILDDYPLPTDTSQLSFEFDDRANTATDDYYRLYEVRRV